MVEPQPPERTINAHRDYRETRVSSGGIYAEGDVNIHNTSESKPPPPRWIPFRGVANFVGRESQLEQLHQILQRNPRAAISAIAGMGGVGKTELAIQYLERHQQDYPGGICWLTGRGGGLAEQVLQFATFQLGLEVPQKMGERLLEIPEQVRWCWRNWQPSEGLVLLVVDDVTSVRDCGEVLPTDGRFRVLITTRLRQLDPRFAVEIPLDVLERQEAIALLASLAGEERVGQSEVADQLCAWLGDLPLGLQLVGGYLAQDPDLSLGEMLERLREKSLEEEAVEPNEEQSLSGQAGRGLKAAFELSWQELDETARRVTPVLSLFAPKPNVWIWDWVEKMFVSQRPNDNRGWALRVWRSMRSLFGKKFFERYGYSSTGSLQDATRTRTQIQSVKQQLYQRHLVERVGEGYYALHPLTREFLAGKLEECEGAMEWKRGFAKVFVEIAAEIPNNATIKQREGIQMAISHLQAVAENLVDALGDDDLVWPFLGLGRFYEAQGSYSLAEPWREQCLVVTKARLGREHPDTAGSLNNLAALYKSQGRYDEAEPLLVEALEITRKLLGREHPDTAGSLNNLAALYESQGRYDRAEPLYLEALETKQQLLGREHPDTALSLNNLAALYESQGRYDEAEPLLVEALEITRKLLGREHPDTAGSLNNLAGLYDSQGRYDQAEPLFVEALEIRQQLLGREHPSTATSLNNLAALYDSQGRYDEAEPLYLEALEIRQQLLGREHPDTASSLNNLAALYYNQGRYAEAEPLFLEALEISDRALGTTHPHTATIRENLERLRAERES